MSSFAWLIGSILRPGFRWPSFVEDSHGSASPWAEAAGGASRQRTMRAWYDAALGRVFCIEGRAQALRVGDRVLGPTRGSCVCLALGLRGARGTQAGVAHWASTAGRDSRGRASRGGAVTAGARRGQWCAATEARC